jgi:hypothetical protein
MSDILEPRKKLPEDFDPSAEMWDRIFDDLMTRGAPCLETVEQLLEDACQVSPRAPEKKPQP